MSKKLAVGARKVGMTGRRSASKRELIDAGKEQLQAKRVGPRAATSARSGRGRR